MGSGNAPEVGCDLTLSEMLLIGSILSNPQRLFCGGVWLFDEAASALFDPLSIGELETAGPSIVAGPLDATSAATRNGKRAISFHLLPFNTSQTVTSLSPSGKGSRGVYDTRVDSMISIDVTSVSPIKTARVPSAGSTARLRVISIFSVGATEALPVKPSAYCQLVRV